MGKIMVDGKPASGSFDDAEQIKYGDSNVDEALDTLNSDLIINDSFASNSIDLNDVKENARYVCNGVTLVNMPTQITSIVGSVDVIANKAKNRVRQTINNGGIVYTRLWNGESWSDWSSSLGIGNLFKVVSYTYASQSYAANTAVSVTPTATNIPSGYTAVAIRTFSSGHNNVPVMAAHLTGTISCRNVTSSAGTGTPVMSVLCIKNL